jgi:hypothetical protein
MWSEKLPHLLDLLERTPALLFEAAGAFDGDRARRSPRGFSWLEHVWHLADLEREGYAVRIARLQAENRPRLSDFKGDQIARERRYVELDVEAALVGFARARAANVLALCAVADWTRAGEQDEVGPITLADLPRMMRAHDAGHFIEIAELLEKLAPGHLSSARLRSAAT